ncbi:N-acetylmuramoyl-L-alanine amidase [Streptomyces sp. NPDC058045]|uniref:N-acetylmuramoyl-L-alanine amidase n=1 Tax=Streptomyces sp. NPDC058045 TaxID=3346311 RepID=UPI0036EE34A8
MATPLSPDRMVAALKAEGVRVVQVGNWRTHNRNSRGAWGPVNGSIVHHTVTRGTASTVALVRNGHSTLPGPLCHGMIAKDGTVHMVGWGRTNHAGGGDPKVLQHVINEDYTGQLHPTRGNSNGVDGNAHYYGWECENLGNGQDPWPAAQYDAIVRVQAALCRAHGWSAKSVIGHLEWSSDKVDPRGFAMTTLRADVAERLKHPAGWNPSGSTTPTTPDTQEDDMQLNDQVGIGDWMPRRWPDDKGLKDKKISVETALGSAYGHSRVAHEGVDALRKEVAAVTAQLAEVLALLKQGRA